MASVLAGALLIAASLTGTVRGGDGTPVSGAQVVLRQEQRTATVTTDAQGQFTFPDAALPAVLEVSAKGFATVSRRVAESPADVVLSPASVSDSVIVTGERAGVWRDPRTGSTVLSRADLDLVPAVTADEALHVVSGFSLFRRSSSRYANPTTHGVTMRGLSASGASRALILLDGVPLNDGFGGWVTWTRLPPSAVARVDVDRGAVGDAFGSDALGGVIRFVTPLATAASLRVLAEGGSTGIRTAEVSGGGRQGAVSLFGATNWFRMAGSIPVVPETRGAADAATDVDWVNAFGRADVARGAHRLTFSGWGGRDDRGNGTRLQRNRMAGGTFAAAYQTIGRGTTVAARFSTSPNHLQQTFSTVASGRATETLTSTQFTDTLTTRATVEVGHNIPRGHLLVSGFLTRATATFEEQKPSATTSVDLRDDSEAVSVHASLAPHARFTLGAGVRQEWRAAPTAAATRDRATVGHFNAVWQAAEWLGVRGSVATSHRWPTLNELVRNFQAGTTLTLANPNLGPERARSEDIAVVVSRSRWQMSAGMFQTVVNGAIANVTLPAGSVPGFSGTVRERRNAGEAHATGVELDGEVRLLSRLRVRGSATLIDAHFRHSLEAPLEGKLLPQVPRVSASLAADVQLPGAIAASFLYHYVSTQFDDDRNSAALLLQDASQIDLRVAGRIQRAGWYVVVENAADSRIEVGRSPLGANALITIAPGRAVRAGVTWTLR